MSGWQSKKAMKSIEQEIADKMGNDMAREIDREVLWGMLKGIGWTRVMINRLQDNKHAVDITHWLALNCQGAYERRGRDFIFEDSKDATLFILRWI
jgi:hypothetical protein